MNEEMLWQSADIVCGDQNRQFLEELRPDSLEIANALTARSFKIYSMGLPLTELAVGKELEPYTCALTRSFWRARHTDFKRAIANEANEELVVEEALQTVQHLSGIGPWNSRPLENALRLTALQYHNYLQEDLAEQPVPGYIFTADIPEALRGRTPTIAELGKALEAQGKLHFSKENLDQRFQHTMALVQLELSWSAIFDITTLALVFPDLVDEAQDLISNARNLAGTNDLLPKLLMVRTLQHYFADLSANDLPPPKQQLTELLSAMGEARVDSVAGFVHDFGKMYAAIGYKPSDEFNLLNCQLFPKELKNEPKVEAKENRNQVHHHEVERHLTELTSLQDRSSELICQWEFNGTGPARKAYRRTFQPFRNVLRGGLIVDGERIIPSLVRSDDEAILLTDALNYLYGLAQTESLENAQESVEPVFTLQRETCAVKQKLLAFCKENSITCNPKDLEAPCDSIALLQDTTTWPSLKRIIALRWPDGDQALNVANTVEQLLFYLSPKE